MSFEGRAAQRFLWATFPLAVLAVFVGSGALLLAKDEPTTPTKSAPESTSATPHDKLIERLSGSVVAIKYVMNARFTSRRGPQEVELNRAVTGTVVHEEGLVMVPINAMSAKHMIRVRNAPNVRITGEPSKIRVIFPGSDKEHPAILGAQDSRLGLAFVLLKSTEDTSLTPVSFDDAEKPQIGSTIYGVGRLDEGFDYAPYCDSVRLVGKVKTPRDMWLLRGAAAGFAGDPLFTAEGALVGVASQQEGAGNSTSTQMCLLPLGVVKATIKRSLRESQRALEEALEADAEAEEAAKEAEEAAKAASDDHDGDDEDGETGNGDDADKKKDDGDKPVNEKKEDDKDKGDETKKDEPKKDAPKEDPKKGEPKKDEPE